MPNDAAEVAERVMGWTFYERIAFNGIREVYAARPGNPLPDGNWTEVPYKRWQYAWQMGAVPEFFEDPSADYSVLEQVRETWSGDDLTAFSRKLHEGWCGEYCIAFPFTDYKPGDYARAALAVVRGRETTPKEV